MHSWNIVKSLAFVAILFTPGCASRMATASPVRDPLYEASRTSNFVITDVYAEQQGAPLTPDDILTVNDMGGVAISPTGQRVAFLIRHAEEACNCYRQSLHVLSLTTGEDRIVADVGEPFTAMLPQGATHGSPITPGPRWSPTGEQLAFVRNLQGRPTLFVYDLRTQSEAPVPTNGLAVQGFAWTRDGSALVVQSGQVNPDVRQRFDQGLREGFLYGSDFNDVRDRDLPLQPDVPIFYGDGSIFPTDRAAVPIFLRSSDGRVTPAENDEQSWFMHGGASFSFGPLRQAQDAQSWDRSLSLHRLDTNGTDQVADLELAGPATQARPVQCGDACAFDLVSTYWEEDRRRFIVQRRDRDRYRFYAVTPEEAVETAIIDVGVAADHFAVMDPTCDVAGAWIVCVEETISSPPRLVGITTDGSRRILYDPNRRLRSRHYNRIERLEWTNAFGAENYGFLVYPTGYDGTRRYPVVVVQYSADGFARGGTGNENPIHPYAEAGFFVFVFQHPNVPPYDEHSGLNQWERGASNFRRRQGWTEDSLDRVLTEFASRGLIDLDKVALTGFSGGGNLIDYALSNGMRVATVICSQCGTGPEREFDMPLNQLSGRMEIFGFPTPLRHPDYEHGWSWISPTLHIQDLHTSMLLNMSQDEMSGAYPLFAKMRYANIPVEFLVYSDEYHVKRQPWHRAAIFRRNIDWLRFWLLDEEDTDPDKAAQFQRWRQMRTAWTSRPSQGNASTQTQ